MDELDEIRARLWNQKQSAETYPDSAYQRDLMDQYRTCIELADRISARRGSANSFFLTFNTAIVGALGTLLGTGDGKIPAEVALIMFAVAIVFCLAWALLLRSYRNLNSAKFKVIGLLEEHLPASPLVNAEWQALGRGKDWRKYVKLSLIENLLPPAFIAAYVALGLLTLPG